MCHLRGGVSDDNLARVLLNGELYLVICLLEVKVRFIRWQWCSVIINQPVCSYTSITALDNNMHQSSLCEISGSPSKARRRQDHQCHSSFSAAPYLSRLARLLAEEEAPIVLPQKMSHQLDYRDFLVESWLVSSFFKLLESSGFWWGAHRRG